MDRHHKTLDENQVTLLRRVLKIYELRSAQTADEFPGRSSAYTIAADLLRAVLDCTIDEAEDTIDAYTENVKGAFMNSPVAPCISLWADDTVLRHPDIASNEEMSCTAFARLLNTIKTDGTDESKEENLRRWNQL